ncbi:hypothetical protein Oscil6304_1261 [Oscillatoria acuminata PCC 6304]|uniref:Uncharacterized protein n=1 Tax=Oscillatoria acuminata PCC 6304 TaxID=56110 RepID=K9TEK6_9CYAN|nr:hypothetical protein Oscil6304_1261 [Oscillatoria acuminata PCC 6304]
MLPSDYPESGTDCFNPHPQGFCWLKGDLTPQPPSLRGKGEPESPSPLRGGVWGEVSFLIRQQSPQGCGYRDEARLRGLI